MKVSIITPTFMQDRFITDTIESVRDQSYKNIEHVILDSMSPDNTRDIIEKYVGTYNLRYLREKDSGQANAINKGLDCCTGDVICWLNSDDYFFDNSVISKVVSVFKSNRNIDVITGDGYYVSEKKVLLSPIFLKEPKFSTFNYMKKSDHFLQPSTFWRKNKYKLDETLNYTFDWDLFLTFYKNNLNILYQRDYYSCYRIHSLSKTVGDTFSRKKEVLKIVLRENKFSSITFWAWFVCAVFYISEKLRLKILKRLAIGANKVMNKISGGYINAS